MKEVSSSKLNKIDNLLEMIEFLIEGVDAEKFRGILPIGGIKLTLKQLREDISSLPLQVEEAVIVNTEIKEARRIVEQKTERAEEETATNNVSNENMSEFVKGLSSNLSTRIKMAPTEQEVMPQRQGRIRQMLSKEQQIVE